MNLRTVHSVTPLGNHRGGHDHFCRALYVAIQIGPSHLGFGIPESGVWSLRILKKNDNGFDITTSLQPFLLIARRSWFVTATNVVASTGSSTGCPSI